MERNARTPEAVAAPASPARPVARPATESRRRRLARIMAGFNTLTDRDAEIMFGKHLTWSEPCLHDGKPRSPWS